jgi:hypothetical protein
MAFSCNPGLIRSAQAHARHRGDETAKAKRPATAARSGQTPDTGRRQGRDPLPPRPHLKLTAEPGEPQQRGDDQPDE